MLATAVFEISAIVGQSLKCVSGRRLVEKSVRLQYKGFHPQNLASGFEEYGDNLPSSLFHPF